jgi:hypothetical protein
MFVYVNGYGLRPFKAVEMSMFNNDINNLQFKGKYKLPKNSKLTNGKKWVDLDHWFRVGQIKETKA